MPFLGLPRQRARAGFGDGVILGVATPIGLPPSATNPAALLEADEGGIQRPLVERQGMLSDLLKSRRESVRVLWAHRLERAQHDQVKRPLQQGDAVVGSFTSH